MLITHIDKDLKEQILYKIEQKYGPNSVKDYSEFWSTEKEKQYLQFYKENQQKTTNTKDKLIIKDIRVCTKCNKYTLKYLDDYYLNKYNACMLCYIKYFEGKNK
jgi:hydrogenase maturation factor HypF (carbamoyltransferase family)